VEANNLAELVDADDRLDAAARADLRTLADGGAREGAAAVALAPDRVEGQLYLALNLSLLALAKSRAAAVLEGLPGAIREHCDKAIAIDKAYADGGALRLLGRFLSSAPWPVRDLDAAQRALEDANAIAPVRANYLFLGDVWYRRDDLPRAAAAWAQAVALPAQPATAAIDGAVQELARRRLALCPATGTAPPPR